MTLNPAPLALTCPQGAGRHAVVVPSVAMDAAQPHDGEVSASPVVNQAGDIRPVMQG